MVKSEVLTLTSVVEMVGLKLTVSTPHSSWAYSRGKIRHFLLERRGNVWLLTASLRAMVERAMYDITDGALPRSRHSSSGVSILYLAVVVNTTLCSGFEVPVHEIKASVGIFTVAGSMRFRLASNGHGWVNPVAHGHGQSESSYQLPSLSSLSALLKLKAQEACICSSHSHP